MTEFHIKILVKLPNKLGDTIMATSFLWAVKKVYPDSQLDVIMAKGIIDLKYFMPQINRVYEFSKKEYSGPIGNYKFGKFIANTDKYDLFFCLPFSFSSAIQAYFSGSDKRIGHKADGRGFLLTNSYNLPDGLHVVEDYVDLLKQFIGKEIDFDAPKLRFKENIQFELPKKNYIVLNVRSGPPSRFIPIQKAVEIIKELKKKYSYDIVLTGAPFEKEYIDQIEVQVKSMPGILNLAGKTTILQLGWILKHAKVMVTTDSGNAHYANALNTKTVVLFGAGLQSRCHPYNKEIMRAHQLLDLECVPCRSEKCKYGDNRCLTGIENSKIIKSVEELIS